MDVESAIRQVMVYVAQDMYRRGYVSATEGNLSARLDGERLLITPSGASKGRLTGDQLVVIDTAGRMIEGEGKPSSEIALHLEVYRERPDINAVIHAHPPVSTAFTVAGVPIAERSLPEILIFFGKIPTAPYGTPTTPELPRTIRSLVRESDAVLLEMHGSLTLGRTLVEAYENLERLEWAAEVTLWAKILGGAKELSGEQIEKLVHIREKLFGREKGYTKG